MRRGDSSQPTPYLKSSQRRLSGSCPPSSISTNESWSRRQASPLNCKTTPKNYKTNSSTHDWEWTEQSRNSSGKHGSSNSRAAESTTDSCRRTTYSERSTRRLSDTTNTYKTSTASTASPFRNSKGRMTPSSRTTSPCNNDYRR